MKITAIKLLTDAIAGANVQFLLLVVILELTWRRRRNNSRIVSRVIEIDGFAISIATAVLLFHRSLF